jgi:hypothetical protein
MPRPISVWLSKFWFQGLLSVWLVAGTALAVPEEIIYDNTDLTSQMGTYYPNILEYGDEVLLAGDARTITRFQFDYYGEFSPTGKETVIVRFYANDKDASGAYSEPPNRLLFESGPMPLAGGYNTLALNGLQVPVPDHFTWTVQFGGLTGAYMNRAGLLFCMTPIVGDSFNDIWQRDATGWNTYFWSSLKANYTARIYAESETTTAIQSIKRQGIENRLSLCGPAFASVALDSTSDFIHWTELATFTLLGKPLETTQAMLPNEFFRFYRLRKLAEPTIKITELVHNTNNGSILVRMQGAPGRGVTVLGTTNMTDWTVVGTDYFISLNAQYLDYTAGTNNYIDYRVIPATNSAMLMISSTPMAPGKRVVLMAGPPGRDCVVETSNDLRQWTPASTNTFSFYSGDVHYLDMQATGARFYRTRMLPLIK